MKALTALVLLLLISLSAKSQNLYEHVLEKDNTPLIGRCIVPSDVNGVFFGGLLSYRDGLAGMLDDQGNPIWTKSITNVSTGYPRFQFNEVINTSDSCFLMVGDAIDDSRSDHDVFCIKMNALGDTLWTRTLDGGEDYSSRNPICFEDADSSYLISWGEENDMIHLAKISPQGNVIWTNSFEGNGVMAVSGIDQLSDSSYILGASVMGAQGDGYLLNIDPLGGLNWGQEIAGFQPKDFRVLDTSFIIFGYHIPSNRTGLLSLNNDLTSNWYKSVSEGFLLHRSEMYELTDSTSLACINNDYTSIGFVFDHDGNVTASRQSNMIGNDAMITSDHGALFFGNGPVIGIKNLLFNDHIGLVRVDSNLNTLDGCSYSASIYLLDETPDPMSPFVFTETNNVVSRSTDCIIDDVLLEVVDQCVDMLGGVSERDDLQISVYPTVSNDFFTFDSESSQGIGILIFDTQGKRVASIEDNSPRVEIDLSEEEPGVYFYQATDEAGRVARGKLILVE